ncbi:MFS transporter [Streptomyces sp. NPDC047981]|uniref:MFS transporter n=1 Tax=Streptomyces sp. NPDC047981 TaxID=3154610 RepID=UPI00342E8C76
MPIRLVSLILAIFCVGTAELVPSGMLHELSDDLAVSISTAGLLVAVYALTMAFGGPLVTLLTTRIERRTLMTGLLAVSVVGNIVSASAGSYAVLVVGRIITAIIHGTFVALCVVAAGSMVPKEKAGSAVAATQLGINLATVLGVPLGTFVGQHFGWRTTFSTIAVLGVAAALLVWVTVPTAKGATDNAGVARELKVFKKWDVLGTVLATALCSGGMFTLITYMVPLLTDVSGFADSWVPGLLIAYGVGSIVGNMIGGRLADRALMASIIGLSTLLTVTLALYWLVSPVMALSGLFVFLFSVATFALIPGLQTRVLSTAAEAPTLSLTANMSAFGVGAAVGSWYGGEVIDLGLGVRAVPLAAAVLTALGTLVVVQLALSERRRRREPAGHASDTVTVTAAGV